jgi:hypothetical protein
LFFLTVHARYPLQQAKTVHQDYENFGVIGKSFSGADWQVLIALCR